METPTYSQNLPGFFVLVSICITIFGWCVLKGMFNYWSIRRMPHVNAFKCLRYNILYMLQKKKLLEISCEQYGLLEGHSYGGVFEFFKPIIILRDPLMVKDWLIKGFKNFPQRFVSSEKNGKSLSGNLFLLAGDGWHTVRTKLAPAFSSAKLKFMYRTLKHCADDGKGHLQDLCSNSRNEAEIDIKDFMSRYAMDMIGACAMGIDCNAIKDPINCQMRVAVSQFFSRGWRFRLRQILTTVSPWLARLASLTGAPSELTRFLTSVTKNVMQAKKKADSTGKDFLQIMMNTTKSGLQSNKEGTNGGETKSTTNDDFVFTEEIMVGVLASFLAAGLDTITSTMTYCLYELAYQPRIQDRIFDEIQAAKNESNGDIEFEDLKNLNYLQQVVNETLRLHPPAGLLFRYCTEPFKIPDSSIVVEKGVRVYIPVQSFHHDPKYFPEPEKFNPERFSTENVDKIVPGSFLPFGAGPRFCIGTRLALMNVESMLITLLSDFTIHTCARTKNRLECDRGVQVLSPKGAVWLCLRRRNQYSGETRERC